MLSSRRVLALLVASCAVAAVTMPVVALAHGGSGGRRSGRSHGNPAQICRQVGVSLSGSSRAPRYDGQNGLTEAQLQEVKIACTKLAAAYATERSAVGPALSAEQQALVAAFTQLNGVCPRSFHRPPHGSGPTGASGVTGPTGTTGVTATPGATAAGTTTDAGSATAAAA